MRDLPKQAFHDALLQVEIEKELRRQLLEVDEHSSHQARQLELLHDHTLAMHTLAPGELPFCHLILQNYHEAADQAASGP